MLQESFANVGGKSDYFESTQREAFENTIRINMAVGGSTNFIIYLLAIARLNLVAIPFPNKTLDKKWIRNSRLDPEKIPSLCLAVFGGWKYGKSVLYGRSPRDGIFGDAYDQMSGRQESGVRLCFRTNCRSFAIKPRTTSR